MSKRTVSMNPYAQSQALKKEGSSGGGTAQSTTLAPIEGINATNLQDATAELYGDIVNVNRFAETVSESLADSYDNTATYDVGDYVTYSGSLYKCNTAVSVPESFDENKWTHILVTEIVEGNNYSSNEIVVGRWINGKPLYRKVFSTTTSATADTSIINFIDISDLNIDTFISLRGTIDFTSVSTDITVEINVNYSTTDYSYLYRRGDYIAAKFGISYVSRPINIIIEYTKSTD